MVTEIVVRLEGEALRKVFMEFQPHWRRNGRRTAADQDWDGLIRNMVWQICEMSKFYRTYKLLHYYFSNLEIDTIYILCEKYDGFHVIYEPDELQQNRIQILDKMARDIFSDIIYYEDIKEVRIKNRSSYS